LVKLSQVVQCGIGGLEKRMALGSYPAMSLKAAREARDTAKKLKDERRDPVLNRQVAKLRAIHPEGDTFQSALRNAESFAIFCLLTLLAGFCVPFLYIGS
jgi:hypothetical protein